MYPTTEAALEAAQTVIVAATAAETCTPTFKHGRSFPSLSSAGILRLFEVFRFHNKPAGWF